MNKYSGCTHIVSYSGGVGSAITADLVCQEYGSENVVLLFADTLIEDNDLYRFNSEVVNLLGCRYQVIADGRTPWQVFNDVKFIGNSRIDPCSKILKRDLIKRWIRSNYKENECIIWVGIDCFEEHRLNPVIMNNIPYQYRSILIERAIFLTQEDKKSWCDKHHINVPRLYKMGFPHNNCGGFCVKAGLTQFEKLYRLLPDVYLENESQEQLAIKNNPNLRPFLVKTIKGVKHYLTLKSYREQYLDNKDYKEDKYDYGGCGCAL